VKFKAVIPAAGEGRRLRPHTQATPKPLIEVAGKPILGHIIDRLLPAKPDEVCVIVGASGEPIKDYLTANYQCRFSFVVQDDPKGLGDAVYRARERFSGEPALVMLGDTIVDADIASFVGNENIIAVKEVADPQRFGIVEMKGDVVTRLVEKPHVPPSNLAVVGVYFFTDSKPLFASLERLIASGEQTKGEFQLTDALQQMVRSGTRIVARKVEHWLDCGTSDALLATNRHLLSRASRYQPRAGCLLVPPLYIHEKARVENSIVGPNVSIGADAVVRDSIIRDSIVNRGARLESALLEGSILGESSVVKGSLRRLNLGGFSELDLV